jgi:predicted small metal-binding protein
MAKELSCRDAGYDCDFMIRSENETELVEFVQEHAKDAHDMDMSRSDVQDMLKEA